MPETAPNAVTSPERRDIREFYDGFTAKLVQDFVRGNVRQARAFELVCSTITPATRTILDVGCGIGASSASYVGSSRDVTVHGVDISPNNVRVATALFGGPRVRFSVSDMMSPPDGAPYDLIALVDMHEHIPRTSWPAFHDTLGRSLSATGTVVITTPSPLHQDHLRIHKPGSLQVVDETIVLPDVIALAGRLSASIIRYEWVGIWHANDYVYTVISRAPRFDPIPRRARWGSGRRSPAMASRLEDLVLRIGSRAGRVRRALRVRMRLGAAAAGPSSDGREPQDLARPRDIALSPRGDKSGGGAAR